MEIMPNMSNRWQLCKMHWKSVPELTVDFSWILKDLKWERAIHKAANQSSSRKDSSSKSVFDFVNEATDYSYLGNNRRIACSYYNLPNATEVGRKILIADGTVQGIVKSI
jgi:hypothetical protein